MAGADSAAAAEEWRIIMYDSSIVRIAKRDNNNKRKYLVINEKQGKHIPVKSAEALKMFGELADILKGEYGREKLLAIGFAETATAIGEAVAIELDSYYMHTTRENIEGVEYLYFTESHSHATEQKLVKNDIDGVIGKVDRVVFVEDEVTTGNTIMSIVKLMRGTYGNKINFSVASILNGMDKSSVEAFDSNGIRLHYLVKTNHSNYTEIAEQYAGNGAYAEAVADEAKVRYGRLYMPSYINARRLHRAVDYKTACDRLCDGLLSQIGVKNGERCLVLGTEEFMFPAIWLAGRIDECGGHAMCHATTRSPIEVSREQAYPLKKRFELVSVYDEKRRTFVYDLEKYDKAVILTDAEKPVEAGINSIINALCSCGNDDITVAVWQSNTARKAGK